MLFSVVFTFGIVEWQSLLYQQDPIISEQALFVSIFSTPAEQMWPKLIKFVQATCTNMDGTNEKTSDTHFICRIVMGFQQLMDFLGILCGIRSGMYTEIESGNF